MTATAGVAARTYRTLSGLIRNYVCMPPVILVGSRPFLKLSRKERHYIRGKLLLESWVTKSWVTTFLPD